MNNYLNKEIICIDNLNDPKLTIGKKYISKFIVRYPDSKGYLYYIIDNDVLEEKPYRVEQFEDIDTIRNNKLKELGINE